MTKIMRFLFIWLTTRLSKHQTITGFRVHKNNISSIHPWNYFILRVLSIQSIGIDFSHIQWRRAQRQWLASRTMFSLFLTYQSGRKHKRNREEHRENVMSLKKLWCHIWISFLIYSTLQHSGDCFSEITSRNTFTKLSNLSKQVFKACQCNKLEKNKFRSWTKKFQIRRGTNTRKGQSVTTRWCVFC